MAHKTLQLIIGRILTGEEFRDRFLANPVDMLSPLSEMGDDVIRGEIKALTAIERRFWEVGTDWIDGRLQRCAPGPCASVARGNGSRHEG
jgi:hypothetical protein